jgi:hypothetical protein
VSEAEDTAMNHTWIGSAPAYESFAQLGTGGYTERAWRENRALIRQLIRMHGEPPPGARAATKSCPHDLGTYYEVVCYFDPEDSEAAEYA